MKRRVYLSINRCPVHREFWAICVSSGPQDSSTRLTSSKCCGQWREERGWYVDADEIEYEVAGYADEAAAGKAE